MTKKEPVEAEVLTTSEVAKFFSVSTKTVTRWANENRLVCVRTPGGHRRFYTKEVLALLERASVNNEKQSKSGEQSG